MLLEGLHRTRVHDTRIAYPKDFYVAASEQLDYHFSDKDTSREQLSKETEELAQRLSSLTQQFLSAAQGTRKQEPFHRPPACIV